MTKEIGVGKAHSKIILMGEHSVVYGYPAISLPLNHIEVTCRVFSSERPWALYAEDNFRSIHGGTTQNSRQPDAAAFCVLPYRKGKNGLS